MYLVKSHIISLLYLAPSTSSLLLFVNNTLNGTYSNNFLGQVSLQPVITGGVGEEQGSRNRENSFAN